MQEVGRIRAQYNDLNTQLDLMKNIIEEKQVCLHVHIQLVFDPIDLISFTGTPLKIVKKK